MKKAIWDQVKEGNEMWTFLVVFSF